VLACLPAAPPLGAQDQPKLRPGALVEVVSLQLEEGFARGRIHLLTPDTLSLLVESVSQLDLALHQIAQLRVNVGKDLRIVFGASAAGALLGALLAPSIPRPVP